MRMKAKEAFTCYPGGDLPVHLNAGDEFDLVEKEYGEMLVKKGHAVSLAQKPESQEKSDGSNTKGGK